jgi:hypothetical protein
LETGREPTHRTFSSGRSDKALYDPGNLHRRLDESTLRAGARQRATDEDEMTEETGGPAGGGTR